MEPVKEKRPVFKKIGGALKGFFSNALVRGTLKTIPLGNLFYEWVDNIKAARDPGRDPNAALPHSPISLMAQTVFLFIILWAFFTGQLTIERLLQFFSIDDFKSFGPDPGLLLKDTLR